MIVTFSIVSPVCFVKVLGTALTGAKWRALALLVLGCILVASPSLSDANENEEKGMSLIALGYSAVLSEVVLSGFASIYFEKIVKSTSEVINHVLCLSISLYLSILITTFRLSNISPSNQGSIVD